jgi:hypothetical protein
MIWDESTPEARSDGVERWQNEALATMGLLTALPAEVSVQIMIQSAAHA